MRVVFHAPLKPPDHPLPSGDRQTARCFVKALALAGTTVEMAPRLQTYDGAGDPSRQDRLSRLGTRLANRLVLRYRRRPRWERPDVWFTYHLYHKAPDYLGPIVSAELGIPYVIAEASHAPKQRSGAWARGLVEAASAIRQADRVLVLNASDRECLEPLVPSDRMVTFPPMIDAAPFQSAARSRREHRLTLAKRLTLPVNEPWLLSVAMMRPGDKAASYKLLGEALSRVLNRSWRVLIVGDGAARMDALRALAPLGQRAVILGRVDGSLLEQLYATSDIYVWPAIREAFGVSFLEAQAAGCPVVAGRTGGVPDVVADGKSGLLVPVGNASALARATSRLLASSVCREAMGARASHRVRRHHDLPAAADRLAAILSNVCRHGR